MSSEQNKDSSEQEHIWVPVPPSPEGEAGEPQANQAAEVPLTPPPPAEVPVTPPPPPADASPAPQQVDEPAPVAPEPAPPEPAPVEPAPVAAEPEPEPPPPEPAPAAAPPASPEPAAPAPLAWEPPLADSDTAIPKSGSNRPELLLAAGFAAGFLFAQLLRRLAR